MSKDVESELEQEFRKLVDNKFNLINAKLNQANQLIDEAISISEEYGIPFSSSLSQVGQSYYPNSFRKKFPDLDIDFVSEVTGSYHNDPEYGGWEHSAVC